MVDMRVLVYSMGAEDLGIDVRVLGGLVVEDMEVHVRVLVKSLVVENCFFFVSVQVVGVWNLVVQDLLVKVRVLVVSCGA